MCNMLELSRLFVSLGELVKFFSAWGTEKLLGCGLLGGSVPGQTLCIDVKINGYVPEQKSCFKDAMIDFLFQTGLGLLHYLYY